MTQSRASEVPTYSELMLPAIKALDALGGAAPYRQIIERTIADGDYTESQQAELVPNGSETRLHSNIWWALWYLAKAGVLDRPKRGTYAVTERALTLTVNDVTMVASLVNQSHIKGTVANSAVEAADEVGGIAAPSEANEEAGTWRNELLRVLRSMPPASFERLCQRLLRESGFTRVEVTGKSGDGGIDGTGVLRIADLLSFRVIFQCKRYTGVVGAPEVRNFRGAMVGRTDKGLFITTGSFTSAATYEAARDGAPPIDLIDGEQLCDLLKQHAIGVRTELVERIEIDPAFFQSV
jgi:restriction system protein